MDRAALTYLRTNWLTSTQRKPLVVRGARQVGKTWLVRQLADITKRSLIELNFERQPQLVSLFATNDPREILLNLGVFNNKSIDVGSAFLFLDEVQAAPEIISKLRWFAEELPELPVIAAGSLLEFVLQDYTFSMPVGRINYMHLEPLSFEEFLLAKNRDYLHKYISEFKYGMDIPDFIHNELTSFFKEYILIGGMPAAVSSWISNQSLPEINQIHQDLLSTYRDDFHKYRGRIAIEKLDEVMMAVPQMLGKKFMYSKVNPTLNTHTAKQILYLLNKARICHRISGCDANGVPLSAEINEKYFKEIFFDTGLCNATLGITHHMVKDFPEISLVNKGGIAEQIVGQLLRTIEPFYIEPALYYWNRDVEGSSAEVDYIIAHGSQVVPIEVKAGSTGSLKSLHLFMEQKKLNTAIRINSERPTKTNVKIKGKNTKEVRYTLLSLPFYLTGQIHRLLDL